MAKKAKKAQKTDCCCGIAKSFLLVNVGSDERPASQEVITDVEKRLKEALAKGEPFVTHHAVQIQTIYY